LSLAFAGDVHFERRVATLLADPKTTLGEAGAVLSAADVALLNLETPITGRGTPEQKRYLFRAPAPAVQALTAAGVDAVSLANNHTLDYGSQELLDTVAAARRGRLGVFGAGRNDAEAFTPWRRTVKGVRIAVFGFSQVDDLAETWAATPDRPGMAMAFAADRAAAAVTAARANSDLVIVMPHWGTEGDPCPNERQQAFADRMAAAGADIVVGAHSHVLQGAGYRGKTFVAYGMGNFLWYSGGLFAPFSSKTGVLVLKVRGREVVGHTLQPAVVSSTGRPRMLSGWQADLARRTFAGLRGCARLEPAAE
jgi:poly-gamma-glutamate synthesis protein (capsule biosynthesis protein)